MTLVIFSGVDPKSFVYNDTCRKRTNDAIKTKDFDQQWLTPSTQNGVNNTTIIQKELIVASHINHFCQNTKPSLVLQPFD
jgi:hypothetical protein